MKRMAIRVVVSVDSQLEVKTLDITRAIATPMVRPTIGWLVAGALG